MISSVSPMESSISNNSDSNNNQWSAEEAIGGNAEALQALRELIIFPLHYSRQAQKLGLKWPRGLLLYGPPGTGKTSLVRAVVRECGAYLTIISPHSVHRAHAGESERILREAFSDASSHVALGKSSVIFIDEIDALCPRRDSKREQDVRVASQLFTLMDSNKPTSSAPGVVVVASTNRVDAIDPALRRAGRFDAEIEVTVPNEVERFQILKLYTKKIPLDPSIDLKIIAASCNGYVGADLEALCREATMFAVKRSSDTNKDASNFSLTMEDWKNARSAVGPSITRGVTVEIPKVTWEDIGGLKELKKKLQQAVEWPIKHSAAFSRLGISPVRGILLHGPPGCSKTTLAKAAAHAAQASFFSLRRQKIAQQRKSLPIASVEKRLVEEIRKNDILIIVGETGSGKTTQIPQFLFSAGFCHDGKVIGITQPRRVAAITVAKRVAEECGVELGQKVAYSVRFDDATSTSTRIKYMTDGLLLREALLDPYLSKYSVIIVDEAHERTVHTDVLMGLLKTVQLARSNSVSDGQGLNFGNKKNVNGVMSPSGQSSRFHKKEHHEKYAPLKLIIMSASLDARTFSEYFGGAKAVHIQGRQFPVDIFYTRQAEPDYLDAALITIFQIHCEEGPGDILVFLTGQEEIESVGGLINERLKQLPQGSQKLLVVPIFAALPSEQQLRAFAPAPTGSRKVILATNIAETSITIPGIKYVIDPGFVKARSYDPGKGMESLVVVPTSKSQALQRSGRAGREGPGKCFRLYPENEFDKLEDSTKPEIKRCNLSNVILQLKALGVDDILGFDFIEKPSRAAIIKSLEQLFLLGALTDDCQLSDPVGRQMARLPLDPIYSKSLILASQFNCLEEMLITVAMLSVESIFYAPRDKLEEARTAMKSFSSPEGDHITLINVYRASNDFLEKRSNEMDKSKSEKALRKWCKENFINSRSLRHALDIHRQIQGHIEQMGLNLASCGDDMLQYRRCLAASFFLNAAVKQPEGTYRALASGQVVQIHPSSVLFRQKPECIIFNELVQTNNKYIRNLTRIDYLWLTELAPQYYTVQN